VTQTRLAVLGHPIHHSRSPVLHASAYAVLGLPWTYEAADVTDAALPSFVAALGPTWRGLSLTMPLKRAVVPLLDEVDDVVAMIGVANTVLFRPGADRATLHGFNTDVGGVMDALLGAHAELHGAHVLGSGATAASVLVALARLGAASVSVSARSPQKAGRLETLARQLGIDLTVLPSGTWPATQPSLVVSTVPGGARLQVPDPGMLTPRSVLLDVAYDPWPTPLAARWSSAGGTVLSGLEMLMWQALRQVRVFVSGDQNAVLQDEHRVVDAMRASVGLPAAGERYGKIDTCFDG
jgi:shikimate dehydrogenase